jgi:ABC-2 type transport system permease protein
MIAVRPAPASPLRALTILIRWRVKQMRQELPQLVAAQILVATGTGIGLGFLIPRMDPFVAAYLATGAFLINLALIAVAFVPQTMTEARTNGSLDYMWSLPFSRLVFMASEMTIWMLAMLPGMVVSLVVTSIRYDFDLHISPLAVPAIALVLLTGASVGAAIGLWSPSVQLTGLIGNALIMVVLLFAPVNFPADRLPGWLQAVHRVLPIEPMADIIRATLVRGIDTSPARDLVVLTLWCGFGLFVTMRAVNRRV